MKDCIKKISGSLISALVIAALMVSMTLPCFAWSEQEDNNDFAVANTIEVNQECTAVANGDDSVDYFKFTTPSDGYVYLEFSHEYGSIDKHWTFYDSDEKVLSGGTLAETSEQVKNNMVGLGQGTYYLEIDTYVYYGDDTSYKFKVVFTASDEWEKEYNDNVVNPTDIEIDKLYSGSCYKDHDNDYYRFVLEEDSNVSFTFNHVYDIGSFCIKFNTYDKTTEEEIKYFDIASTSQETSDYLYLTKGEYYVVIKGPNVVANGEYSFILNLADEYGTPLSEKTEEETTEPEDIDEDVETDESSSTTDPNERHKRTDDDKKEDTNSNTTTIIIIAVAAAAIILVICIIIVITKKNKNDNDM